MNDGSSMRVGAGWQTFGKKSQGVSYGQKTRTPHLMRISLIIVRTLIHRNIIHIFLVTQERT